MFRLAGELAAAGYSVVTSTTTRLAVHEIALAPAYIACEDADRLLAVLPGDIGASPARVSRRVRDSSKGLRRRSYSGQVLERIAALPDVDFLLVEADGSHERCFKAPATHEPLITGLRHHRDPCGGPGRFGPPADVGLHGGARSWWPVLRM